MRQFRGLHAPAVEIAQQVSQCAALLRFDVVGLQQVAQGGNQWPAAGARRLVHDLHGAVAQAALGQVDDALEGRSEEHTSELQSLMRISYAVFCSKKKHNNLN